MAKMSGERINVSKLVSDDHSMLGHLLLSAMTATDARLESFNMDREDGVGMWAHVRFTINGVECDAEAFAENVWQQLDRMIADKAKAIVEERLGEVLGEVDHLGDRLKRALHRGLGGLGEDY